MHPSDDPRVVEAVGGGAVFRGVRGVAGLGQAPVGGRRPPRGSRQDGVGRRFQHRLVSDVGVPPDEQQLKLTAKLGKGKVQKKLTTYSNEELTLNRKTAESYQPLCPTINFSVPLPNHSYSQCYVPPAVVVSSCHTRGGRAKATAWWA